MQWLPALEEAARDPWLADRDLGQVVVRVRRRPGARGGRGYPRVRRVERGRRGGPARGPARRRRDLRVATSAWTGGGTAPPRPSSRATPRGGAPSRTPGCRSWSSATARSHPTTSTSAPPGTRSELTACGFDTDPRSPAAGWRCSARRGDGIRDGRRLALLDLTAWICPGSGARSSSATSRCTGRATTSRRRTPRRWPPQVGRAVDDALAPRDGGGGRTASGLGGSAPTGNLDPRSASVRRGRTTPTTPKAHDSTRPPVPVGARHQARGP